MMAKGSDAAGARVLVVMGVSGSGKTTVGRLLAERLGWDFADADVYHSPENVGKMRAGIPLTDADRAPWLEALRARIMAALDADTPLVLACSALRRRYRDVLRVDARVGYVYLHGDRATIAARSHARSGHFMPPGLLESQFAMLEEPADALWVDVDQTPDAIVDEIIHRLSQP